MLEVEGRLTSLNWRGGFVLLMMIEYVSRLRYFH